MVAPASPLSRTPAYRADIDGLRGLAVLSVMLFHAGIPGFGGGFVGVDVFFVISGFLITQLILADCEAGRFSLRRFYERRVRRLLPALLLVLGFSFIAGLFVLSPGEMRDFSVSAIAAATFSSNIYFWRTSGYFEQAAELKPLLHTWSLAIEAQFYIAFPFVLLALRRFGERVLLAGLIVALVASLLVAQGLVPRKPIAAFFTLPTRAWELALGAVLAVLMDGKEGRWRPRARPDVLALLGLGLIAASVVTFTARTAVPGFPALIPTVGAALVILAGPDARIVFRLLTWKPLLILGLASYSAYLWHHPLLAFGRIASGGPLDPTLAVALLGLSILLALLTWQAIEKPFRDRSLVSTAWLAGMVGAAMSLIIATGIAGHVSGGFLTRYPVADRQLAGIEMRRAGEYVQQRFHAAAGRSFASGEPRRKVVLIGDSFAQDLLNAAAEGGFETHFVFSTHHVTHGCASLAIQRAACLASGQIVGAQDQATVPLLGDPALVARLRQADEIWLAAAWQDWQIALIPAAIQSLRALHPVPVRVFGRKDFGRVSISALLAMSREQRLALMTAVDPATPGINAAFRGRLAGEPGANFIDLQALSCGGDPKLCPLFTPEGDLKSHDGGHLTKEGAAFLGRRLAESEEFRTILQATDPPLNTPKR